MTYEGKSAPWPLTPFPLKYHHPARVKGLICTEKSIVAAIPVDDALLVQELEREHDFSGVEPGAVDVEAGALLDVEHQVAAVQVLHHEEQVRLLRTKMAFNSFFTGSGKVLKDNKSHHHPRYI